MSDAAPNAQELWSQAVPAIKDRVNHRSLWETCEKTVGLAIDEDTLILGLNPRFFNQAGHMNVSEHRNAIELTLSKLAGRPLTFRIIEGDTPDDWALTQKRDARVSAMREANYDRRDKQEAESQSWDSLMDYIARTYSGTHMRSMPQNRAKFFRDALRVVADTMEKLYTANPDENTERHLARIIEKLAHSADLPATYVALELDRVRDAK